MTTSPTFPSALHAARAALRLTQRELGAALGITGRTLARWEQGDVGLGPAEHRLVIQVLAERDREQARRLAASLGGHLEDYGVAPPPPAATSATEAANMALYAASELADVSPGRLRAAVMELFERLRELGLGLDEAREALERPASRRGLTRP